LEQVAFGIELERLGQNFGVRGKILEDKAKLLWDEFKGVPYDVWKLTCKNLLENEDRFPTIKKFKEALRGASMNLKYRQKPTREITICEKCEGSGYLSTVKVNNDRVLGEYLFRCDCENGAYRERELLVWHDKFKNMGHVLRVEYFEFDAEGFLKELEETKKELIDPKGIVEKVIKIFDGKVVE